MKKYILILLIISPIIGHAQDRNVFWTHGLNDNADFWNDEYARAEWDYRINSSGFTYPTNAGVSAYADRIRTDSYYLERVWDVAWNQLIDARVLETYTTTELVYDCNTLGVKPIEIDEICEPKLGGDCGDCGWVTQTVTRTRWVNQPSDGFIKRDSQIGRISKWGGQAARLPGVNHLEMGIHPETNALLNRAFKNGAYYNFFQTTPR